MTTESLDKMLVKVRGLIAKAEGTDNEHEADAFRQAADALMTKYAIQSWQLESPDDERKKPVSRDVDMSWYSRSNHSGVLYSMMLSVARHCRVKVVYWKYTGVDIPVVGLPSDIDYFDMLFTSLSLELAKGLEPKPDPNKDMIENLVLLKESGQKWLRIAEQLWEIGQLPQFDERPTQAQVHHLNFSGKYTAYCKKHNRERLRVTPGIYQRSFAHGFQSRISERLYEMRRATETAYDKDHESGGMELAIVDIGKQVERAAVEMFGPPPAARRSRGGRVASVKIDEGAVATGRQRANAANIANNPGSRIGHRRQIGG